MSLPSLRADALERLIPVACDPISATARQSEGRIWRQFEASHPAILGGLLDDLVVMLRRLPVSRDREAARVRMADYQDALHALDPDLAQVYADSTKDVMVEAAAANGWVDRDKAIMETLTSIRRAGASVILTYWATEVARKL